MKQAASSSSMFTFSRSLVAIVASTFCMAEAIPVIVEGTYRTDSKLLLFTATQAFVHDSIPTAVESLLNRASSINVQFDHTEDAAKFGYETLKHYDAVVFLHTSGEALDDVGKAGFQEYINKGGRYVGIHGASDTMYTTEFYGKEVGAYFDYHPAIQNATMVVLDPTHPSTRDLPPRWTVEDEIYNFRSDPRSVGAVVVLTVDETTYIDDGVRKYDQGEPHPIAWYQEHGAGAQTGYIGGRSFYTALGHRNESWADDTFMSHILGGIQWTLGDL